MGMRPSGSVTTYRGNLLPAFDGIGEEAKYFNVQLTYKENEMGGVMALNQPEKGNYRLILMTAFGMPIFDFSISRDSFIVNSCMEKMNKKVVLNILEKDFRSILMLNIPDKFNARLYSSTNAKLKSYIGYGVNADDGECDYLLYPRDNNYVRNIQNGGAIKRMNATFDEQVITIKHPKLNLQIVMTEIKQEQE